MDSRSRRRKLSFEILSGIDTSSPVDYDALDRKISDPIAGDGGLSRRKRRKKKVKKCTPVESPTMNSISDSLDLCSVREEAGLGLELGCHNYISQSLGGSVVVCQEYGMPEESVSSVSRLSMGELRQRSVSGGAATAVVASPEAEASSPPLAIAVSVSWAGESGKEEPNSVAKHRIDQPGGQLQAQGSLDWRQLMDDDPNYPSLPEMSPIGYLMEEMYNGNSLKSTTSLGNEKDRERVYDTIFRLPWRCELLINVGFFVCLNSFLSLFTIMPMRILLTLRRLLRTREWRKLSTAELSDLGSLFVFACGIILLGQIDISLVYHMIRGQGIVKLYVVYNVLEIFDKLFQSFCGDVMETLFSSADGLAGCPPETFRYQIRKYIIDLVVAASVSILHSFVLLAQAITLSTCIVAHSNNLPALLVSNNFSEIKGSVFKRFSKDNVHNIVYSDSVERLHISAFLMFVLAQNILEAEGSWFGHFLSNALMVYLCEMAIDIIKHSFIAKFNDHRPIVYSEFLEDLCRQTLNIQSECVKKRLTFVPLAPASVVIRILTPVYAARLPCGPLPWRVLWAALLTVVTCVMLVSLKVMVGMALQKHAAWYVKRCQRRKLHTD